MQQGNLNKIKSKIKVEPLAKGGSNFDTNVLVKISSTKLKFKPTYGYGLFCIAFLTVPVALICVGIYKYIETKSLDFIVDNLFLAIFTTIFSLGVFILLRDFFKPIVFDKSTNRYYKGFYKNNTKKSKNNIKLSRICAIQIIGEVVQSDNNNYNSYELNLVLDDSTRINVIDHGNLKGVIQDANWLSDFLNIPVWHAGSNKT